MKQELMKYRKVLFVLIASVLMLAGVGTVKAEAAVPRNRAVAMYNRAIAYWGRKNAKVTVVHSMHTGTGAYSKCNKVGKKVSMRPLYYGQPRFIFRDLNGDGTIEALFYEGRYIYVFTIYRNSVRALGAICAEEYITSAQVYYNAKLKSFSLKMNTTVRRTVIKTYQVYNGRLRCINTVSRYTGQMMSNYQMEYAYYVNGRQMRYAYFRYYYYLCMGYAKRISWAP